MSVAVQWGPNDSQNRGLLSRQASSLQDREELRKVASQAQFEQERLWTGVDAHKYLPLIFRGLAEATRLGISGALLFVAGDKKLNDVIGLVSVW